MAKAWNSLRFICYGENNRLLVLSGLSSAVNSATLTEASYRNPRDGQLGAVSVVVCSESGSSWKRYSLGLGPIAD